MLLSSFLVSGRLGVKKDNSSKQLSYHSMDSFLKSGFPFLVTVALENGEMVDVWLILLILLVTNVITVGFSCHFVLICMLF